MSSNGIALALALGALAVTFTCCGSDAAADCPFPATSCADSCNPIDASELDRQRGCRKPVVLGCTAAQQSTTDARCYADPASGRVVLGSSSNLPAMTGWRSCTEDEAKELGPALPCDGLDGGGHGD